MSDDPVQNMWERASQCRRLASTTHDEKMHWQLLEWANEIEKDVERIQAEREA